jgi:hypothetical protein
MGDWRSWLIKWTSINYGLRSDVFYEYQKRRNELEYPDQGTYKKSLPSVYNTYIFPATNIRDQMYTAYSTMQDLEE